MGGGTIAEQMLLAGDVDTSGAFIDFVNGFYVVNGESVALSDIIDQTARVTGGLGLSCKRSTKQGGGGTAAIVRAIGPLKDVLLTADWTIVFEYETTTDYTSPSNGSIFLLQLINLNPPSGTYSNLDWDGDLQAYLQPGDGAAFFFEEMLVSPFTQRFVTCAEGMTSGTAPEIGLAAFTRATSGFATAQDGNFDDVPDGADNTTTISQVFDDAILADSNWATAVATPGYIRTITLYVPRLVNSELAALTA